MSSRKIQSKSQSMRNTNDTTKRKTKQKEKLPINPEIIKEIDELLGHPLPSETLYPFFISFLNFTDDQKKQFDLVIYTELLSELRSIVLPYLLGIAHSEILASQTIST